MQTQVLIVGGGPAGVCCGIRLLQHGIECVVAECETFPRPKVCGGIITHKTQDLLTSLLGKETFRHCIDESLMNYASDITLYDRLDIIATIQPSRTITIIDRSQFDAALVSEFIRLGGRFASSNAINDIDLRHHIATFATGDIVEFRYLMAADGTDSSVEYILRQRYRRLVHPKPSGTNCLQIDLERSKEMSFTGINIYLDTPLPGRLVWLFSKGSTISIGTDATEPALRSFCQSIGLHVPDSVHACRAKSPASHVANYRRQLTFHDVFFLGDAAGLSNPLSGEGLYSAIQSGIYAADSLMEKHPQKYYAMCTSSLVQLVKQGARYQRLLSRNSWLRRRLISYLRIHPDFLRYVYDNQIDYQSFESPLGMLVHYRILN